MTGKKQILIADCDELLLMELERVLQDQGYETTTAWTTADAVQWLERKQFDLLVVADHPPELNSEYILRRRLQVGAQGPVVVLESAPRHPFSEPYLRKLGASRVVRKGEKAEIAMAVEAILGSGPLRANSAVARTINLG